MSRDDTASEIEQTTSAGGGGKKTGRVSRRTTVFVLGSIVFALACVVLAVEYFVVERIPLLTDTELGRAKKLWQEHGPVSYDMEIEIRGARPGSVQINVRNRVPLAETRDGRVP